MQQKISQGSGDESSSLPTKAPTDPLDPIMQLRWNKWMDQAYGELSITL